MDFENNEISFHISEWLTDTKVRVKLSKVQGAPVLSTGLIGKQSFKV